jgi:RNA polymerase sigma factor (TIGR02999 family)
MPIRPTGGDADLTSYLDRWRASATADDALIRQVGPELRRLAVSRLRHERDGHTLQPTDLVHEAYLRLLPQRTVHWKNRHHFFGVAARMMRRVLVDYARKRGAGKRNYGQAASVSVSVVPDRPGRDPVDVLDLHRALEALAALDPRQAEIVELREFGGLTIAETAREMRLSESTVKTEWRIGWLFVQHQMTGS